MQSAALPAEAASPRADPQQAILDDLSSRFFADPAGFVDYAFPWPVYGFDHPDTWQEDFLTDLGRNVEARLANPDLGATMMAVASGHGVGKTALIAWLILWFISSRPFPQIIVTANTEQQLTRKTWRELAKWAKKALHAHLFRWSATKFAVRGHEEDWFASATPWSENNAEAFAGTHERSVMVLMDEGSNIAPIIWETAEGALTTADVIWVVFGNPTRAEGRFYDCFHEHAGVWDTRHVNSEHSAIVTNKAQFRVWREVYGWDSDFYRVRVRGEFPRSSANQLIPTEVIAAASERYMHRSQFQHAERRLGVDVAWEGDDRSVIVRRQGLQAWDMRIVREVSPVELATMVKRIAVEWAQADGVSDMDIGIYVDAVGLGGGVADILAKEHGLTVFPVKAGAKSSDPERYANLRSEMWARMGDWLAVGGCIPDIRELRADLASPQYAYTGEKRMALESKPLMKKRTGESPDCADALSMTFANVELSVARPRINPLRREAYDPLRHRMAKRKARR